MDLSELYQLFPGPGLSPPLTASLLVATIQGDQEGGRVLAKVPQLAETATTDPSDVRIIGEKIRAISRSYKRLASTYEREVDEG